MYTSTPFQALIVEINWYVDLESGEKLPSDAGFGDFHFLLYLAFRMVMVAIDVM